MSEQTLKLEVGKKYILDKAPYPPYVFIADRTALGFKDFEENPYLFLNKHGDICSFNHYGLERIKEHQEPYTCEFTGYIRETQDPNHCDITLQRITGIKTHSIIPLAMADILRKDGEKVYKIECKTTEY